MCVMDKYMLDKDKLFFESSRQALLPDAVCVTIQQRPLILFLIYPQTAFWFYSL